MQHRFEVTKDRFHLLDNSIYYMWGVWPEGCTPLVLLDKEAVPVVMEEQKKISAQELSGNADGKGGILVKMEMKLPKDMENYHTLSVFAQNETQEEKWYSVSVNQLLKRRESIQYYFDSVAVDRVNGSCIIKGWVAAPGDISVQVLDKNSRELPFEMKRTARLDVSNQYHELDENESFGFYMNIQTQGSSSVKLVFFTPTAKVSKSISVTKRALLMEKLYTYITKGVTALKMQGFSGLCNKIREKFRRRKLRPQPYEEWIKNIFRDRVC